MAMLHILFYAMLFIGYAELQKCSGVSNYFMKSVRTTNRFTTIQSGNYTIQALVSFSTGVNDQCQSVSKGGLLITYAIKYAIDTLNNGIFKKYGKIGLQLDDVCRSLPVTMARGIEIVSLHRPNSVCRTDFLCNDATGKKDFTLASAIIGTGMSFTSIPLASLMSLYDIPQISHTASSRLLSKKDLYKSFFRTIPSDKQQVAAMLDIIKKFGWNYIIAIGSDDDYGKLGISDLKREAQEIDVCIALDEYITFDSKTTDERVREVVEKIKQQDKAQVVVLFCYVFGLGDKILKQAKALNVNKIWLTSEAWNPSATSLPIELREQTEGMLSISVKAYELDYLAKYLEEQIINEYECNKWLHSYLDATYKCNSLDSALTIDSLNRRLICGNKVNISIIGLIQTLSTNMPASTYNLIDAVRALGQAMYNVLERNCTDNACYVPKIEPSDITQEMYNVSFTNELGNVVSFDSFGNPTAAFYTIENLRFDNVTGKHLFVPVGNWTQGKGGSNKLELNEYDIVWPKWWSKSKDEEETYPPSRCASDCLPGEYYVGNLKDCCWECRKCTGNTISSKKMAEECTDCGVYKHTYDNKQCIDTPILWMTIYDPAGMTIVIISVLSLIVMIVLTVILIRLRDLISHDEIPPNITGITCFIPLITFVYGLFHIMEPTNMFCQIRNAYFFMLLMMYVAILIIRTKNMTTYLRKKADKFLNGSLFAAQIILFIIFMLLESASIVAWVLIDEVLVEEFRPTNIPIITEIYRQCEVSFTAARLVSTFIPSIMLIIATFTSFRERHLEHHFYEPKFQSFTCIALCIILMAFLPTFKYVVGIYKAIVMAFTMDVFAFTFMACLVLPKVYMAVVRHRRGKDKFPLKPAVVKGDKKTKKKTKDVSKEQSGEKASPTNGHVKPEENTEEEKQASVIVSHLSSDSPESVDC